MQHLTNSETQPAPIPTAAPALEISPEMRASISAALSFLSAPVAPVAPITPDADTTDLKRELSELDARAVDLSNQAADADAIATDAQTSLMTGTGTARAAADARNTQDAIKDALNAVNRRRAAVVAQLDKIAADAAAHGAKMQAVGTAQRCGQYRREVEAAALNAAAALQQFADIARPALDAHELESRSYVAQLHALTDGEQSDVEWHLNVGATASKLRALGADEIDKPNLSALPFGALLAQALKDNTAPAAVYLNLPPAVAAPPTVANMPADPDALAPGFVRWPSR